MMLTWMTWAVTVAAILGVSALLAEGALRERGWPTRWSWAAALVASVTLPVLGALRPRSAAAGGEALNGGWALLDPAWLVEAGTVAAASVPPLGGRVDSVLRVVWAVGALAGVAVLLGGLATLRARAARWHRARVQGESVLLSRDFGPALVGVLSPEIVLPRWALRMSEEDQRLACLHESEHREARDTWLLLGGAIAATLMPWNVALWWQLRRLRAAVEVDCDARVLRRGASRRAYGALLLELGSARGRSPLPILALARSESLLERRLKMIVRNVRERQPARALVAACSSLALFVVACETDAPTTVRPEAQAAVEATRATFQATEVSSGAAEAVTATGSVSPLGEELEAKLLRGELRFFVDGEEHRAVPADLHQGSIERVEIRKTPEGTPAAVYVFTKDDDADEPLVFVDGIRLEGDLSALEPEDIERVEVLKGEAATSAYGPEASAGVIRVTLKKVDGGTVRK